MSHYDGVKSEDFFENFCKRNNLDVNRIHQPFDFLVNGKLVEVKSARFFVSQGKGNVTLGRYECWRKSQIKKLRKYNPWVCFIVTSENGCMIHGFTKAENLPGTLKMSFFNMQKIKLRSAKEFLRYVR